MVVEYEKCDSYGRILGKVLLSDEDMYLEQVKAGLAWHYKKYQGEQTVADRVGLLRCRNGCTPKSGQVKHDSNESFVDDQMKHNDCKRQITR